MKKESEEITELKHEPVLGYRMVFYIILTIALLYLAIILLKTT